MAERVERRAMDEDRTPLTPEQRRAYVDLMGRMLPIYAGEETVLVRSVRRRQARGAGRKRRS